MFKCQTCEKTFTRKDAMTRHERAYCKRKNMLCELCGVSFISAGSFNVHQAKHHDIREVKGCKRKNDGTDENGTPSKISNTSSSSPLPSRSNTKYCQICDVDIPSGSYKEHSHTNLNKTAACCPTEDIAHVSLVDSIFEGRIATYRVDGKKGCLDIKEYWNDIEGTFLQLVKNVLQTHHVVKLNLELFGLFHLQSNQQRKVKSFNTRSTLVTAAKDLNEVNGEFLEILSAEISDFQEPESGWALEELLYLEVDVNKYNPLRASSYIQLPKDIEKKKAILNIQNTDQKCFLWSVLAHLHPITGGQTNRIQHYKKYENELNMSAEESPPEVCALT